MEQCNSRVVSARRSHCEEVSGVRILGSSAKRSGSDSSLKLECGAIVVTSMTGVSEGLGEPCQIPVSGAERACARGEDDELT
jgi:hypothetical protein